MDSHCFHDPALTGVDGPHRADDSGIGLTLHTTADTLQSQWQTGSQSSSLDWPALIPAVDGQLSPQYPVNDPFMLQVVPYVSLAEVTTQSTVVTAVHTKRR